MPEKAAISVGKWRHISPIESISNHEGRKARKNLQEQGRDGGPQVLLGVFDDAGSDKKVKTEIALPEKKEEEYDIAVVAVVLRSGIEHDGRGAPRQGAPREVEQTSASVRGWHFRPVPLRSCSCSAFVLRVTRLGTGAGEEIVP